MTDEDEFGCLEIDERFLMVCLGIIIVAVIFYGGIFYGLYKFITYLFKIA